MLYRLIAFFFFVLCWIVLVLFQRHGMVRCMWWRWGGWPRFYKSRDRHSLRWIIESPYYMSTKNLLKSLFVKINKKIWDALLFLNTKTLLITNGNVRHELRTLTPTFLFLWNLFQYKRTVGHNLEEFYDKLLSISPTPESKPIFNHILKCIYVCSLDPLHFCRLFLLIFSFVIRVN